MNLTWLEVIPSICVIGFLEGIARFYFLKKWGDRGITLPISYRKTVLWVRLLIPIIGGSFFAFRYNDPFAGIAFSAMLWVGLLSIFTDLTCRKIPSGACWMGLGFVLASALSSSIIYHHKFLIILALIVLVMMIGIVGVTALIGRGHFGSGDARLMLSLAPLAAWSGYSPILIGIILGAIIQIPLRYVLRHYCRYDGAGLPFAPAIVAGTAIAILAFGHPGTPCAEIGLVLGC
jgi:hypothetical protein